MRHGILVLALLVSGCGLTHPAALTPETEQEIAVVDETAKAAVRHKVDVHAEVVDKLSTSSDGRAGELIGNTAFFLRSAINEYPVPRMRELAVHEVCHASDSRAHDTRHWCCMKKDGEVGYPPPVTVMGQWPTCE